MLTDLLRLSVLATVVDFLGSLLIGVGAIRTLFHYLRAKDVPQVIYRIQQALAVDLVTALSFKSGAGIIRTLTIADWPHFLLVLTIIGLRFFLSQTFSRIFPTKNEMNG